MSAHAPQICDSSENRLRMLHFNRQIHICYHNIFFLLNKICDGESSNEPFLKAATLSILIWAYPRETKTTMGILKMRPFRRVRQSRTQSPQAFWSAGERQEGLWGLRKNLNLLIGYSVTVFIVVPQKSCGNKIRSPQSLSWVGTSYMVIIMSSPFIFGKYVPKFFLKSLCPQILFLITVFPLSLCYDVSL